jgi:ABC-2 type transport system ATP-binding protein
VGIIDHGEIIALGTQGELTQQVGEEDRLTIGIEASQAPQQLLAALQTQIEGVTQAEFLAPALPENIDSEELERKGGKIRVLAKRGRKALPRILNLIEEHNVEVNSVEVREPDLEAVFLHLTGRALRD